MRKFLTSFLILVVFAAAMICGCPPVAQAFSPASHHSDSGSDHHHGKDTTVAPDCAGTDMQLPQQVGVSKPDLKHGLHFDYAQTDVQPIWSPVLASNNDIRGPPPDWPDLSQTHPSILLITQRLLI